MGEAKLSYWFCTRSLRSLQCVKIIFEVTFLFSGTCIFLREENCENPGYVSRSAHSNNQYKSQIFCLFTFSVFLQGKTFRLTSQCTQKCQYNSLY